MAVMELVGEMMSGFAGRHLFGFPVGSVAAAPAAVFAELETVAGLLPVFERVVVSALALGAGHRHHHTVLFFRHRSVSRRVGAGTPENMKKTDARSVPRIKCSTAPCLCKPRAHGTLSQGLACFYDPMSETGGRGLTRPCPSSVQSPSDTVPANSSRSLRSVSASSSRIRAISASSHSR